MHLLPRHKPHQRTAFAAKRAVTIHDVVQVAFHFESNVAAMAAAFVFHLIPFFFADGRVYHTANWNEVFDKKRRIIIFFNQRLLFLYADWVRAISYGSD